MRDAKGRFVKGHAAIPTRRDRQGRFLARGQYVASEEIRAGAPVVINSIRELANLTSDFPGQIIPYRKRTWLERLKRFVNW